MGLYLRKSFRMGPVRFNLSKSGIGTSFGVRGARVGVNPQGRSYVHAGRYGVYARRSLGGGSRAAAPGGRAAPPEVLYERTDATFPAAWAVERAEPLEARPGRAPTAGLILLTVLGILLLLVGGWFWWLVGGAAFAVGAVFWYRRANANRTADKFRGALESFLRTGAWTARRWQEALSSAGDGALPEETRRQELERAYLLACRAIVEDGRVDDAELDVLDLFHRSLGESPFTKAARRDAFRGLYFAAVADHELDEGEEAALDHVRERLAIPAEDVATELEVLAQLRDLRRIRGGELEEVQPSVPIQKSETCYFEGEGRFLKEKQLSTFQRDGQRYNVRGLVVDKEGRLLVTNKRILLVHSGTSSVRYDKILDLDVDMDENVIRVTKDGATAPTIITTPEAMRVAAIVSSLAGM
ncbi:MAG TPA: DUF4236 domain-containing protein [Longimicrobiales bacterium]|nr:DUF4236 domain-containing protein [Longimicrobiales bacterium]